MNQTVMHQTVVEFKNVSKTFTYWAEQHQSFKAWLIKMAMGRFSSGIRKRVDVLNEISFSIKKGEFVAIMGKNGVGKSTTLKLISGIYEPTKGQINIVGTIAPLIELGAGFDFELSGMENILLNAAILGFSRKETLEAMPSIIQFSELDSLIEMPIKNYSSGMLVRLGFSIATHFSAPILLIDEVLAVGDVGFQKKCLVKIRELNRAGRTIILVTHSPEQAREFASRTIVIDAGRKIYDGPSEQGAAIYLNNFKTQNGETQ